jgi:hypothetical protein
VAGRKPKLYGEKSILKAIKVSGGSVNAVAKSLKCEWHTAKANIERFEETQKALSGEKETNLDLVEGKAIEMAKNGDGAMIRFILATLGRNRGYGEKPAQNTQTVEDNELKIEIVDGNNDNSE